MKKIMSLILLLTIQFTFAKNSQILGDEVNEWDIYQDKYGKYLGLKDVKMKIIKLKTVGPDVEIIKVDLPKEASHLAIVEYKGGSAGTSFMSTIYRAVIYDFKKQKFVGQAPLRREYQDGKILAAKWTYHDGLLTIKDPKEGKLEYKL